MEVYEKKSWQNSTCVKVLYFQYVSFSTNKCFTHKEPSDPQSTYQLMSPNFRICISVPSQDRQTAVSTHYPAFKRPCWSAATQQHLTVQDLVLMTSPVTFPLTLRVKLTFFFSLDLTALRLGDFNFHFNEHLSSAFH